MLVNSVFFGAREQANLLQQNTKAVGLFPGEGRCSWHQCPHQAHTAYGRARHTRLSPSDPSTTGYNCDDWEPGFSSVRNDERCQA